MMTAQPAGAQPFGASPWLTVKQAAAYAQVHYATIYRAIADNRLSASRLDRRRPKSPLRLRKEDVDRWLDGERAETRQPRNLGRPGRPRSRVV